MSRILGIKEFAFVSLLLPTRGLTQPCRGLISVLCVCICSSVLGPDKVEAPSRLGNGRSLV